MPAIINTNIASLNAQRNLNSSQSALNTSLQRLSSGLRINSAKDDAAGLAISNRMDSQIRGLNQAARNANDGISLAQTAEGALGEITNNLQRIRELSVQSRNATNSTEDRAALQKEVDQLKSEIDRVANQTSFNGTKLLDGSFTNQAFQVGANQGQSIDISKVADANIDALGSWKDLATTTGVAADGGAVAATATTSVPSGTYTQAASTAATDAFQLRIGGTLVSDRLVGNATAANLDTDINAFITASNGAYTKTGSVATSDLVISKADGTDFAVATSFSNAVGSSMAATGTTSSGTFDAGFVASHTNGTEATAASFTALTDDALTINGTKIEVGAAADAATRMSDLVTAINASNAGVTASVSGGALTLTNKDNSSDLVIDGTSSDATILAQTGLEVGTTARDDQTGFKDLDISTVGGADKAILAMDAALKEVNGARADLGAVQNRFSSVISNLSTTSENLSAARSRIMDADFASETASLTRGQILQQAGTAMLAQANSLPNGVLSLLRG